MIELLVSNAQPDIQAPLGIPGQDASELIEEPAQDNDFRREDAEEIHASLDELALEHQEVLVLRFLEDMTYQQIAKVTGCPIGTVRSRLHYAKSALRQAIQQRRST